MLVRALPAIVCAVLLLGCASNAPQPITVYKTVEVVRDRYVAPPARLVKHVEIIDIDDSAVESCLAEPDFVWCMLVTTAAAYRMQKTRSIQCNGQLDEIANIGIQSETTATESGRHESTNRRDGGQ